MIEVREATAQDSVAIKSLLALLGYEMSEEAIENHLSTTRRSGSDATLVAIEGVKVLGMIAIYWISMLHCHKPVARITTLVVSGEARGQGLGRRLVHDAIVRARQAGCGLIEVTTGLDREDAKAFYRALGFEPSSLRLHRTLN